MILDTSIMLSDILHRAGLNTEKTLLIRHSKNDGDFKLCYEKGFIEEYTRLQGRKIAPNCDHWLVFISDSGTSAKFYGCFKVLGSQINSSELIPSGFPSPRSFNGAGFYYDLVRTDIMKDLIDRLIIDWGKATISWYQYAKNDKPVLAVQANAKYNFSGFENLILKFDELKEIINDPTVYENWHTALRSVYAIYLIVDTLNGKQYVGSAYGDGGLLSRWMSYVDSKHGNNAEIIQLLSNFPDRYHYFQFSILQILPKSITVDEVVQYENLHKLKLLSREFGMNKN